ncbi:MAG: iron chelate uptake ABC transporter family permease subunit [Wenzhouxiangella sp.]
MAADLLARTVVAPQQLPAGAILALVGAPLFLILLNRSRTP